MHAPGARAGPAELRCTIEPSRTGASVSVPHRGSPPPGCGAKEIPALGLDCPAGGDSLLWGAESQAARPVAADDPIRLIIIRVSVFPENKYQS